MSFRSEREIKSLPLPRRFFRLFLALAALWLIVAVLAPWPLEHIPIFHAWSERAESLNLHPGSLYYTDLPVSGDAERNSRRAVREAGKQ